MAAIPENYMRVISPLIEKAREFLENGEDLEPIAFVGSFTSKKMIPVPIRANSGESKDRSAEAIRLAAQLIEADFVFVAMEAWGLQASKAKQYHEIMEQYGSIGASPYAIDTVSMTLETRYGVWMAQTRIKPKGYSKKKRTIAEPQFELFTEIAGRFSHLLPDAQTGDEPATTLH